MTKLILSSRFDEAWIYAHKLHARQFRKGTQVPYVSHLMAVSALVLEDGGDEDQAISALLHDAVEDQGGLKTLEEIRERFGDRVAEIVEGCSDALSFPKPPWEERKRNYLTHLRQAPDYVRKVSLADKLQNAGAILKDLRITGEAVWDRFNGGKAGTLWYYDALLQAFQEDPPSPMVGELALVVEEMKALAGPDAPIVTTA
jgi:(p)ppGpp synthase/HD superfamily hydrolase